MARKRKSYTGIFLLILSVVCTVPFSWLHHCEYSHHQHTQLFPTDAEPSLQQEQAPCPLCELNVPVYISSLEFGQEEVLLANEYLQISLPVPPLTENYRFQPLRAPPLC